MCRIRNNNRINVSVIKVHINRQRFECHYSSDIRLQEVSAEDSPGARKSQGMLSEGKNVRRRWRRSSSGFTPLVTALGDTNSGEAADYCVLYRKIKAESTCSVVTVLAAKSTCSSTSSRIFIMKTRTSRTRHVILRSFSSRR